MTIGALRLEIDQLDSSLIHLLGERIRVARQIARLKKKEKLPVFDGTREEIIKEKIGSLARKEEISVPIVEELYGLLLDYSRLEMELEICLCE